MVSGVRSSYLNVPRNSGRWLVEVFGVIGATPPSPLDSSFRWKDEVGDATYEVSCVSGMARPFSYQ